MSDETRIQALEDQLGRLQDIRAIEQLKYQYASCCDRGYDPEGIAALFIDDGV